MRLILDFEKKCFKFGTNYMHFNIFFQRALRVHINSISDLDFQRTLKKKLYTKLATKPKNHTKLFFSKKA